MIWGILESAIHSYNFFVLTYFLILNLGYIVLCLFSFSLIRRYLRYAEVSRSGLLFRSGLAPAVSVICPAYNEEASIATTVQSLLTLEYPRFEVVIVNDGSTDRTLDELKTVYEVRPSLRTSSGEIPTSRIRGVFKSTAHRNLVVVDKENGGCKSDAINAGINFTRNPLVLCIDADSVLEPDALLKMVQPFVDRPETVAAGGIVRIVNESQVRQGRVDELRLSSRHLVRFQVMEYLRAFLFGRLGWAGINALPIISGAFGMFARRSVLEVGGYRTDTIGEDMELVLRLHRHHRKKGIPYHIDFIPEPVCWTEAPEQMDILAAQRNRWQRGLIDSLWIHRKMFLNPRYGTVGLLSMPFFVFFEGLGPIIEAMGYLVLIASLALGIVDWTFAGAFFAVAVLLGMMLSVGALVLEGLSFRRYPRVSTAIILAAYGLVENLGFRQLHTIWRLKGVWAKVRGETGWGRMTRRGFAEAKPDRKAA